jgi:diguanylate cyclase (GGDEF)-like protein
MNAKETSGEDARDGVTAMVSSLLTVHAAMSQEWLIDAACTAAERGLNAPFAFVFLHDQDGTLAYKAPASDLRRRSHQRAVDALGTVLFRSRIAPRELPMIGEAIDTGNPQVASTAEAFAPLIGPDRAAAAAQSLTATLTCTATLENAGEQLGVLLALGPEMMEAEHVALLAEHIACAMVNLRNADVTRQQGMIDVVRSVFDARKIESELQRELSRATRYRREVSICVVEATNLRLLRERFGHFLTDRLLQRLGEGLAQQARDIDVIGAYKESGYTMILMEANRTGAAVVADRLIKTAQTVLAEGEQVPGLELHLAVGYATCPDDGVSSDSLFRAAEQRMYDRAAA